MRLNRYIARCGIASRREADVIIRACCVTVNGNLVNILGTSVTPGADVVTVNGEVIELPALHYYKYYKPVGVVSTLYDTHAEVTIGDVLRQSGIPDGVVQAGRLDRDSEGLLILTNDGDLLQRLTHPSHGTEKVYRVLIDRWPRVNDLRKLLQGVKCRDFVAHALRVTRLGPQPVDSKNPRAGYWIELVMGEGKKREIREMLDAIGFKVLRLVRTEHGPVKIGTLKPGEIREMDDWEFKGMVNA